MPFLNYLNVGRETPTVDGKPEDLGSRLVGLVTSPLRDSFLFFLKRGFMTPDGLSRHAWSGSSLPIHNSLESSCLSDLAKADGMEETATLVNSK